MSAFSLAPEQVLMVGDSMSDLLASRDAGVRCAAVVWDSYDKQRVLAASADLVFESVIELLEWFRFHTN
jgi:phosphoglycolate phosphatase-like HAD superfamily hydrolase